MGVYIDDNELAITTRAKTIRLDMNKKVDNSLNYKINQFIKHNELLAKHKIKTRLVNCCSNISMETIFMNIENSKTNKTHKFVLNLTQILDLRSSNKHVAFQNLLIYYTRKNIKQ